MAKPGIINIIGEIGGGGVTLQSVMDQVAGQPRAKEYLVNINSPGGEVTEGYAIHNYLVGINKPVTTRGIGLVASIATVVFMAGRKRELYTSTQFLIHNPWTFGEGDADAMERKAAELRDIENGLIKFYNLHTGADVEALRELMRADRFIQSDQALELRFATEVLTPVLALATIKTQLNKDKMSKVKSIIRNAFAALKSTGMFLNEMVQTADGQELEITMAGEAIAPGDNVTLNGEPATGEFTLADGTMIKCDAGVITEVMAASAETTEGGDDVAALKAEIENLKSQLAMVQNDNTELATNLEVITNHLRKLKVNANLPTKRATFNRTSVNTTPVDAEPSKEEIKARMAELRAKSKKTSIAI